MRCPGCGYVSFDRLETCKRCGTPMAATASCPPGPTSGPPELPAPGPSDADADLRELRLEPEPQPEQSPPAAHGKRRRGGAPRRDGCAGQVEMLDDDAIEVREEDLASLTTTRAAGEERDEGGAPFRIADDLFDRVGGTESRGTFLTDDADDTWGQPPEELSGAKFDFRDEEAAVGDGGAPIIDRDDEVPDRFWDPEVAGLGRRAGALLVDQALLALLVGGFFLGALAAFRLSGFDTDLFLAPPGLRAAALPFALLAALLSFACHAFFHGYALRTPGKALAGIEVRTAAGEQPAWSRVVLRWCGAALGLGAAGVGWAWALFDPRRRGWADLLSGTVVALRRPAGAPRR